MSITGVVLTLTASAFLTLMLNRTLCNRKIIKHELALSTNAAATLGKLLRKFSLWLGGAAYSVLLLNELAMKLSGGNPLYPPNVSIAIIGCIQFCLVTLMLSMMINIGTAIFDYRQLKNEA